MATPHQLDPDPALAMRLASAAMCDPRTAAKVLRHEPVRPLLERRVRAAAAILDITIPPPKPEAPRR